MPLSRSLDATFKASVIIEGINGALEIVGGVILLVVSPAALDDIVRSVTQHELSEDPSRLHRSTSPPLGGTAHHGTTLFAAIYLISHGVAKVALVVALLRDHLWAYPAAIILLTAFIAYQMYRLSHRLTVGLTMLTIFDAFVVWLTWREYRNKRPGASRPRDLSDRRLGTSASCSGRRVRCVLAAAVRSKACGCRCPDHRTRIAARMGLVHAHGDHEARTRR